MVPGASDQIAGLATVPMQDTDLAVAELTRAIRDLGLRGVMIDDHVNGQTYEDDPRFDAFWEAAAALGRADLRAPVRAYLGRGAHRQFFFFNSIGNLVDRTITFGALVYGGVMDRHHRPQGVPPDTRAATRFSRWTAWTRAGARSRQCGCDDQSAEHVRTPLHLRRGHLRAAYAALPRLSTWSALTGSCSAPTGRLQCGCSSRCSD